MLTPWKESYDQPRQHIKKQRHYFVNKGPSNQGYGFSSSHVWMWELDYKESWAPKNWCFWSVVLEKTLESPLDCKDVQPLILKEISPECSLEELMLKLATSCEELTHLKRPWCWERLKTGGEGSKEDEVVQWHHQLDGHEFEWTLGVGDGQGGLACCKSWGRKELDTTEPTSVEFSCLENSMDRGAGWTTVHGVSKSLTRLSD